MTSVKSLKCSPIAITDARAVVLCRLSLCVCEQLTEAVAASVIVVEPESGSPSCWVFRPKQRQKNYCRAMLESSWLTQMQ